MLVQHMQMFAHYNRWANARLTDAVARLDDAAYRADRGLFFGSIHATLNHVLVGDRIWLHRLTGEVDGELPTALDIILHDDRTAVAEARATMDERLIDLAEALDDAKLASTVSYRNMAGSAFDQPLAAVLAHLFNHQTHHRGHVHAALSGLGLDPPSLDLVLYQREVG